MNGKKNRAELVVAVFLFVIAILLQVFVTYASYFVEDGYITLSYAKNFAAEGKLQYSDEFTTFGSTTPLFTLILGVSAFVGANLHSVATFYSLLGSLAILAFLATLAYQIHPRILFSAIIALIASMLYIYPLNFRGMEYSLYSATCFWALWSVINDKPLSASILGSVAATLRIDGMLCLSLVGAYLLFIGLIDRRKLPYIAVLLCLPAFWYSFSILQFRSITTSNLAAKQHEAKMLGRFAFQWLDYFWNPQHGIYIFPMIIAGFWASIIWMRKHCLYFFFCLLYGVMYHAFYIPGVVFYFLPFFLLLNISIAIVFGLCLKKYEVGRTPFLTLFTAMAFVAAPIMYSAATLAHRYLQNKPDRYHLAMKPIAEQLASYPKNSITVASSEIGVLGYYSNQRIIELGGLVNDKGRSYWIEGRLDEYMEIIEPDVIVHPLETERNPWDLASNSWGYANKNMVLLGQVFCHEHDKVIVYVSSKFMAENKLCSTPLYSNHVLDTFLLPKSK